MPLKENISEKLSEIYASLNAFSSLYTENVENLKDTTPSAPSDEESIKKCSKRKCEDTCGCSSGESSSYRSRSHSRRRSNSGESLMSSINIFNYSYPFLWREKTTTNNNYYYKSSPRKERPISKDHSSSSDEEKKEDTNLTGKVMSAVMVSGSIIGVTYHLMNKDEYIQYYFSRIHRQVKELDDLCKNTSFECEYNDFMKRYKNWIELFGKRTLRNLGGKSGLSVSVVSILSSLGLGSSFFFLGLVGLTGSAVYMLYCRAPFNDDSANEKKKFNELMEYTMSLKTYFEVKDEINYPDLNNPLL